MEEKSKLGSPLVLGIVGVALVAAIALGIQFTPWNGTIKPATALKADPNEAFYREKATLCGGDLSKLNSQDQSEVIQRAGSPIYARQILMGYAQKK